jgi:hypothetical protein
MGGSGEALRRTPAEPITSSRACANRQSRCSVAAKISKRHSSRAVACHEFVVMPIGGFAARDTGRGVGAFAVAAAPPRPDRRLRRHHPPKDTTLMPNSSVARADRLAEYGIQASSIRAVSISLKPAPRERVPVRSQFDTRALSGASSTGNLPEPGTKDAGGKIVVAHAARPETDKHISRRGKFQRVAVNANADALIREAKEGRISAEAYAAGFALQGLLERANGLTGPSNREWLAPQGGNKCRGQANAVLKMIETASVLEEQFRLINGIVGMTGMRILTLCLIGTGDGDGPKTFSEVAENLGMARDWTPAVGNDNDDRRGGLR